VNNDILEPSLHLKYHLREGLVSFLRLSKVSRVSDASSTGCEWVNGEWVDDVMATPYLFPLKLARWGPMAVISISISLNSGYTKEPSS
jgi:hypothetical protein